jgi:steroid delta-isomerase-like uncharacterized protein
MSSSIIEANRALGREFFAAQDRLRGGPDPELCDAGYEAILGGNPSIDRAGHEQFAVAFYSAMPDAFHTVDDVFASEDSVAVRFTIRGTNSGSFFGIPASGKKLSVVANVLMDVRNGRVTRLRGVFDEAGMLRQMGVLPG